MTMSIMANKEEKVASLSGNIVSAENIISMKTASKLEYGKHAYAPNVKIESIKNIKILPPLLLRPIPSIAKEIVTVYRTKRNVNNLTNSENITEKAEIENGTVPSVKIDQVTQAITVTQISGTPPPANDKNVTPSLNFQPFSITSSDFKNNSAIVNSEEIDEEVAKLINDKFKEVTLHFDTEEYTDKSANNSEENEDITDDEDTNKSANNNEEKEDITDYEDEDEEENNKQINQNEEDEESKEDTKEKYQNNEEAEIEDEAETESAEKSLIINVPEPTPDNKEETKNIEESSDEDDKTKKEDIEEFPEIDEFLKHIIPSKFGENSNGKPSNNNEKSNFDFSLETQDKENEETKEEKSVFDDFFSEQKEANNKLRTELEYPDLDNDYEKYRQDTLNSYLGTKEYNFKTASKPYEINLEGYFPYEKQLEEDDNVEDDENDKEKIVQHEYRDDEDEREEAQVENKQNENNEESSENKYIYWPPNKDESKIVETTSEQNVPHKNSENSANIIQEINKILEKKNAISRQQEINNPEQYNTFWSLKYKVPKH